MPEPVTWQVLEVLADQVRAVSVDDGFHTDLGSNVSLAPYKAHDGRDGSIVRIASTTDTIDELGQGKGRSGKRSLRGDMDVVVEYALPASRDDAMLQAHRGRADLVRVLKHSPELHTAGARTLTISGRQILDQPDGLPVVIVQINVRVGLYEGNPPPTP